MEPGDIPALVGSPLDLSKELSPAVEKIASGKWRESVPLLVGVIGASVGGPILGALGGGAAKYVAELLSSGADKRMQQEAERLASEEERARLVASYLQQAVAGLIREQTGQLTRMLADAPRDLGDPEMFEQLARMVRQHGVVVETRLERQAESLDRIERTQREHAAAAQEHAGRLGSLLSENVDKPAASARIGASDRPGLRLLATRVRTFWIDEVLQQSLRDVMPIELRKRLSYGNVDRPFARQVATRNGTLPLADGEPLESVFEAHGSALLILGEPGSGKTIALLELAHSLLERFEQAEDFGAVPVVLSLSSWSADDRELHPWIVRELRDRYGFPAGHSDSWLRAGRLIMLLDGLDEVVESRRLACLSAINEHAAQAMLAGLVVSCRLEEYRALGVRLKMPAAVEILPLDPQRTLADLERAGYGALREVLERDEVWRELASTPLMLGVMASSLSADPASLEDVGATVAARRRQVLALFVDRMIERHAVRWPEPFRGRMRTTLARLARAMKEHTGTLFALDLLQPSWLPSARDLARYVLATRILAFMACFVTWQLLRVTPAALSQIAPGAWLPAGYHTAHLVPRSTPGPALVVAAALLQSAFLGWLATKLTLLNWRRPRARALRWFGRTMAWAFGGLLGQPVLMHRALSRDQTSDITLLRAWRWSKIEQLAQIRAGLRSSAVIGAVIAAPAALMLGASENMPLSTALFVATGLGVGSALAAAPFLLLLSIPLGFHLAPRKLRLRADEGPRRAWVAFSVSVLTAAAATTTLEALLTAKFGPDVLTILLPPSSTTSPEAVAAALGVLLCQGLGASFAVQNGGLDLICHHVLALMLRRRAILPRDLLPMLDAAREATLIQHVGGSYRFSHASLQDMLADEAATVHDTERAVAAE